MAAKVQRLIAAKLAMYLSAISPIFRRAFAALVLLVVCVSGQADGGASAEVFLLIDVSGSMKTNDPKNLRAPALRMLAGIAPADARVGIFAFGTSVKEIVPPGKADANWKVKANRASKRIHSRAMYTNIEAALNVANSAWSLDSQNNIKVKRSIILLTDGVVDIAKEKQVSEKSRSRIIDEVLPELLKNNVTVHTIALSANADHELLKKLALATDGHAKQVADAEALQRLFLRLFEQAAPQDSVPLVGNKFTVDASVSEVTLLVFNKNKDKPTTLLDSNGFTYVHDDLPENIKWKRDTGYDLITIKSPYPGEWQIIAEEDPDNRALIVTDLKLQVTELPSNVMADETLAWYGWLEESNQIVTKPEFLKLISATITAYLAGGEQRVWQMEGPNSEGRLSFNLGTNWPDQTIDLAMRVDGKTFVRERRMVIHAHNSPVSIEVRENIRNLMTGETPSKRSWDIKVVAKLDLLDIEQSKLTITAESQTAKRIILQPERTAEGWQVNFSPLEPGQFKLFFEVQGQSLSGRPFVSTPPMIEIGEPMDTLIQATTPVNSQSDATTELFIPSNFQIALPVLIGNIILALMFAIWFVLRRRADNFAPEAVL